MLGWFQVASPVADHVECVRNARTRLGNNSQLGITGNGVRAYGAHPTRPQQQPIKRMKKGYLKNEFQVACPFAECRVCAECTHAAGITGNLA